MSKPYRLVVEVMADSALDAQQEMDRAMFGDKHPLAATCVRSVREKLKADEFGPELAVPSYMRPIPSREEKTMAMTFDEVREALKLKPFWQYWLEIQNERFPKRVQKFGEARALQEVMRGTGRTTRIMCEALVLVSEGKLVAFVGDTPTRNCVLTVAARALAEKLGLDQAYIRRPGTDELGVTLMEDHPHS